MAVSNSYDYNLAGEIIILETMELLGQIESGESVSTNDAASCLRTLNLMIKFLQAEGIGLWLNQEATLFLEYEETSYALGPSGDHASVTSVKTEVATAAAAAALTLVLDSVTGMTTGDAIGIELDDGTLQWTTINGVPNVTTLTVTITAALTDDVAVGNHVYTYTDLIQRPLEIFNVRRKDANDYETPVTPSISRQEYMALSNKSSAGPINQVYYDPQLTNGVLYTWPACNDVQDRLLFTMRRPIMDFDAGTDDPDLPQEWLLPIAWNLAVLVAPKFGVKLDPVFLLTAGALKNSVAGFDVEQTSVYLRAKRR